MQVKPGIQFDETQQCIVETSKEINVAFIKNSPNPKGEFLKKIFIKEADVCILNSLDCNLHLLVGVNYSLRSNDGILLLASGGITKKSLGDRAFAVAAPRM